MFFSLQEPHIKIIEINYQSHSQNAQYEMVKLKKKMKISFEEEECYVQIPFSLGV